MFEFVTSYEVDGGVKFVGTYGGARKKGLLTGFLLNSILLISRLDFDEGLSFHIGRCKDADESIRALTQMCI